MVYSVNPEVQQPVRNLVAEIGPRLREIGRELDRKPDAFSHEIFKILADKGLVGFSMPKEYGGGGRSALEYATMIEELSYWDAPSSLMAAVSQLAIDPITRVGTDEQKREIVPRAAKGEIIPAFALAEPGAGSDEANQQTTVEIDGDEFVIHGEKIFVMHGDVADVAVVFGRIREEGVDDKVSTVIVPMDIAGVSTATLQHKVGMRYATTGRIWFENARVPRRNLVGEPGKGSEYALMALDGVRIGIAAQSTGIAQRALDESVRYAKKRVAFGSPIAKLQAIQWMIADMATKTEAARLLTYKAAQSQDAGVRFSLEALQARLFAAEASSFCVDRAMQIHSGYGYIGEFSHIEKLYRDQHAAGIHDGTSEARRLAVADNLLRG